VDIRYRRRASSTSAPRQSPSRIAVARQITPRALTDLARAGLFVSQRTSPAPPRRSARGGPACHRPAVTWLARANASSPAGVAGARRRELLECLRGHPPAGVEHPVTRCSRRPDAGASSASGLCGAPQPSLAFVEIPYPDCLLGQREQRGAITVLCPAVARRRYRRTQRFLGVAREPVPRRSRAGQAGDLDIGAADLRWQGGASRRWRSASVSATTMPSRSRFIRRRLAGRWRARSLRRTARLPIGQEPGLVDDRRPGEARRWASHSRIDAIASQTAAGDPASRLGVRRGHARWRPPIQMALTRSLPARTRAARGRRQPQREARTSTSMVGPARPGQLNAWSAAAGPHLKSPPPECADGVDDLAMPANHAAARRCSAACPGNGRRSSSRSSRDSWWKRNQVRPGQAKPRTRSRL